MCLLLTKDHWTQRAWHHRPSVVRLRKWSFQQWKELLTRPNSGHPGTLLRNSTPRLSQRRSPSLKSLQSARKNFQYPPRPNPSRSTDSTTSWTTAPNRYLYHRPSGSRKNWDAVNPKTRKRDASSSDVTLLTMICSSHHLAKLFLCSVSTPHCGRSSACVNTSGINSFRDEDDNLIFSHSGALGIFWTLENGCFNNLELSVPVQR